MFKRTFLWIQNSFRTDPVLVFLPQTYSCCFFRLIVLEFFTLTFQFSCVASTVCPVCIFNASFWSCVDDGGYGRTYSQRMNNSCSVFRGSGDKLWDTARHLKVPFFLPSFCPFLTYFHPLTPSFPRCTYRLTVNKKTHHIKSLCFLPSLCVSKWRYWQLGERLIQPNWRNFYFPSSSFFPSNQLNRRGEMTPMIVSEWRALTGNWLFLTQFLTSEQNRITRTCWNTQM